MKLYKNQHFFKPEQVHDYCYIYSKTINIATYNYRWLNALNMGLSILASFFQHMIIFGLFKKGNGQSVFNINNMHCHSSAGLFFSLSMII